MRSSNSQIKLLQSRPEKKCIPLKKFNEAVQEALKTVLAEQTVEKKAVEAVEEALKTVEMKTGKKAAERKKAAVNAERKKAAVKAAERKKAVKTVKLLPEATQALQVAAEDHLTRWMVQLTLIANHAGRKEQSVKDQMVLNKLAQTSGGWPQI